MFKWSYKIVVGMRQFRKYQNKVSSQTSYFRKYNQCSSGFLFLLLYRLCQSDVFLDNLLIHYSSRFLLALINLFFSSRIPLLLAYGAFGKPAWWVVSKSKLQSINLLLSEGRRYHWVIFSSPARF